MIDDNIAKLENERRKAHGDAAKHGRTEYLPALFLTAVLFFLPVGPESGSLNALAVVFVSIVLEAIPFMLAGSLVGGFIEVFVSRERLASMLPRKGWPTVFAAAAGGILFPVCECAVVPVVRRLVGKGLPLSAAIAYLLGGPVVNPVVAASTALAYGLDWSIVALRTGLGYGVAVFVGLAMGKLFAGAGTLKEPQAIFDRHRLSCGCRGETPEHSHIESCDGEPRLLPFAAKQADVAACGCGCARAPSAGWIDKTGEAFVHATDDFLAVGHYLVVGAFIAALAQTYVDRQSFLSLTGVPILPSVLMMALAILLNLCSEADAFVAASFRGLISVSAQLAFMLTGPMFDLKLLLMYQSLFRRKAIVVLAALVLGAVLAVVAGLEFLEGGVL